MNRQEIMEYIAEYFGIEPDIDDDGNEYYDIDSYDWQSGCYIDRRWFSPAEVVRCIEGFI